MAELKVGDKVTRLLSAAKVPMVQTITNVTDTEYWTGVPGVDDHWTFDKATLVEIDHDLGWGPSYGITGSYLLPDPIEENHEGEA